MGGFTLALGFTGLPMGLFVVDGFGLVAAVYCGFVWVGCGVVMDFDWWVLFYVVCFDLSFLFGFTL